MDEQTTKEFGKMNICITRFGIRNGDREYLNEYTPFGSVSLCIKDVADKGIFKKTILSIALKPCKGRALFNGPKSKSIQIRRDMDISQIGG